MPILLGTCLSAFCTRCRALKYVPETTRQTKTAATANHRRNREMEMGIEDSVVQQGNRTEPTVIIPNLLADGGQERDLTSDRVADAVISEHRCQSASISPHFRVTPQAS